MQVSRKLQYQVLNGSVEPLAYAASVSFPEYGLGLELPLERELKPTLQPIARRRRLLELPKSQRLDVRSGCWRKKRTISVLASGSRGGGAPSSPSCAPPGHP